jgi:hypothetical protein
VPDFSCCSLFRLYVSRIAMGSNSALVIWVLRYFRAVVSVLLLYCSALRMCLAVGLCLRLYPCYLAWVHSRALFRVCVWRGPNLNSPCVLCLLYKYVDCIRLSGNVIQSVLRILCNRS